MLVRITTFGLASPRDLFVKLQRDANLVDKNGERPDRAVKERETDLQTELKGGTFWTRTKRAAKWLIIGAGVRAAAVHGSSHRK